MSEEEDLLDDDTAELEVLALRRSPAPESGNPDDSAAPELARAAGTQAWLEYMQGELERLQRGWSDVQAELDAKSSRIAELAAALEQERHAAARLRSEIEERDGKIAELDSQIEALRGDLGERDETLAGLAREASRRNETLTRQRARIDALEAQIKRHEQAKHLLDRNLERLDVLGTSLRRLDRAGRERGLSVSQGPEQGSPPRPPATAPREEIAPAVHAPRLLGLPARKLFVMHEGQSDTSFLICKQQMTIGRSRQSDIRVNGDFVSRIHARVFAHGIGTVIEDADSKNGLLVNSEPVTRCVLKDGDIVSLAGRLDLKYVELDDRQDAG